MEMEDQVEENLNPEEIPDWLEEERRIADAVSQGRFSRPINIPLYIIERRFKHILRKSTVLDLTVNRQENDDSNEEADPEQFSYGEE